MEISLVIPVRDEIENLKKCIDCIKSSKKKPYQIIIVDDASVTDIKAHICDKEILIIKLPEQSGPSYARNVGAKAVIADIILFLDADVFIKPDTLQKIEKIFEDKQEDAVVGLFDDTWHYRNFFSDYKNLWMRYTYENIGQRAALFFTSIAAIRKDIFFKTEGFDERYKRPSIEDTAFGNVLWKMGIKPFITSEICVFHNKEYSLFSLLKTDFIRAADLLKAKLRKTIRNLRNENTTSVPVVFIISVATTVSAFLLFFNTGNYIILASLLIISIFLNYRYLFWLYRKRGFIFCLKSALFIFIDHFAVFFGLVFGFLSYLLGKRY